MGSTDHSTEPEESSEEQPRKNTWYDSVQSVADGIAFDVAGKVFITALGFALNLILTRALGATIYGVYTFGRQIVMVVLLFTNLGTDVSNMKFIAANTDDLPRQQRILGLSYVTTLVVSILVAVGLYVAAPFISTWTLQDPQFVSALRVFALGIPFYGMTKIAITTFRGLERAGYQTVIKVVNPLTQLVAIGGAILLGADLIGIVWAFVAATVAAFLISLAVVLSQTNLRPVLGRDTSEAREFFNFSLPFTLARAGGVIYRRTDVFMIGILLASSTAVGIYNIALLIGSVITMPLVGINQLFPSVASRLHANDDHDVLESVYTTITRWSITASLVIAAPIFIYRETFMGLFGEEFVAGATLLAVLAAGQLVNAAAGPSNDVLTMTDHQYLVMVNHWVFGVMNVVLNVVLITEYGVIGAAIATAVVLGLLNMVRVVEVWYLVGMFAYTRRLWKPVVATGAAIVALVACQAVLSGLPLLVIGSTAGVVAYGLGLLALGFDDRDREFARRYVPFEI